MSLIFASFIVMDVFVANARNIHRYCCPKIGSLFGKTWGKQKT